jgi:hypothetical protein
LDRFRAWHCSAKSQALLIRVVQLAPVEGPGGHRCDDGEQGQVLGDLDSRGDDGKQRQQHQGTDDRHAVLASAPHDALAARLSAHAWARLRVRNGIGDPFGDAGAFDRGLPATTSEAGHGHHEAPLVRPPHGPVGRARPRLILGLS